MSIVVLVVEDHVMNQVIAQRMLESLGHSVAVADNGQAALDWLRDNACDFVFMDCAMPVMDGYEATRRIRLGDAGTQHRDLPIVALTAHALASDRAKCVDAGMNAHLMKPASRAALADTILRHLQCVP